MFLPGEFHGQRILADYSPWGHKESDMTEQLTHTHTHQKNEVILLYSKHLTYGTPLQYSCLENPMDGGAWWAAVHGVARSWTWLSDCILFFHFRALEKEMATHSSVLAWRIPGMGEPGRLLSMGSHRVRHDWSDLATAAAAAEFYSTRLF